MRSADILILAAEDDHTVEYLLPLIRRRGLRYAHWDPGSFPSAAVAGGMLSPTGWQSVELKTDRIRVQLDEVRAVWLRRSSPPRLSAAYDDSLRAFIASETLWFLTSLWSLVDAPWVNPVPAGRQASDKAVQLSAAITVGMPVPATYMGNDPARVRELSDLCDGRLIVKPFVEGGVTRPDGGRRVLYTSPVGAAELNDEAGIRAVPAIWQHRIEKAFELRITVVGDAVLAGAIYSQDSPRTRHDWRRYDFGRVRHRSHKLDGVVERQCRTLVSTLGLRFGAIDMIVDPGGVHHFLEINPFGQWLWMEQVCNLPIGEAHTELFEQLCRP